MYHTQSVDCKYLTYHNASIKTGKRKRKFTNNVYWHTFRRFLTQWLVHCSHYLSNIFLLHSLQAIANTINTCLNLPFSVCHPVYRLNDSPGNKATGPLSRNTCLRTCQVFWVIAWFSTCTHTVVYFRKLPLKLLWELHSLVTHLRMSSLRILLAKPAQVDGSRCPLQGTAIFSNFVRHGLSILPNLVEILLLLFGKELPRLSKWERTHRWPTLPNVTKITKAFRNWAPTSTKPSTRTRPQRRLLEPWGWATMNVVLWWHLNQLMNWIRQKWVSFRDWSRLSRRRGQIDDSIVFCVVVFRNILLCIIEFKCWLVFL